MHMHRCRFVSNVSESHNGPCQCECGAETWAGGHALTYRDEHFRTQAEGARAKSPQRSISESEIPGSPDRSRDVESTEINDAGRADGVRGAAGESGGTSKLVDGGW